MRTDNLKKLLTGVVTTPEYSSSSSNRVRVITPRSGAFKSANGQTVSATSNGYAQNNTSLMHAVAGNDMTSASLFRTGTGGNVVYKAWSQVVSHNSGSSSQVPYLDRCVSATYDSTNTPISSADYALKGTDVACTVAINDDTKITITFSNSGSSVAHANRIGLSMALSSFYFLLHVFAFDDIALAPGETKSITIQPDLD